MSIFQKLKKICPKKEKGKRSTAAFMSPKHVLGSRNKLHSDGYLIVGAVNPLV